MVRLRVGDEMDRDDLLRRLVQMQYARNDLSFTRGTFRVRETPSRCSPCMRNTRCGSSSSVTRSSGI
jgi:excinuclease UvrABC helicase subunit UvrB